MTLAKSVKQVISLDPFMMKLIESEWLLFGMLVQVIAVGTMSRD